MDCLSGRAKSYAKQLRYYWTFLTFVLIFVLVLWTFQLALIVRFQTFWPSGGTLCFSAQDVANDPAVVQRSLQISTRTSGIESPLKIVCYYVLDSNYSSSIFNNINVNPFLCTHLNVGFAKILNGSLTARDEHDYQVYKDLMNLKEINPQLKILISAQEYSSPNGEFPKIVSTDIQRKKFAINALQFIQKYGFDGLDIDWEFPSWPKSQPDQKHNFTLLLKEIRTSFNISSINGNSSTPILSIAVGAPASIFLQCYDIADMAKYVDWINMMSYDYHLYSKLTPITGPNAPLYQRPQDSTLVATLNTNWSAAHWAFWGMPKNKIIIGIPTYGHSFKLLNSDNTGWYAPAVGIGSLGEVGFTTYPDACMFILKGRTTHVWDDHYKVPYAYQDSEWISFESLNSVKHKAEMIVEGGYGGAMIFSLNTDDSAGVCRQGSFPLTSVVHLALQTSHHHHN